MPHTFKLSSELAVAPSRAVEEIGKPWVMLHVSRPVIVFRRIEPKTLPERWEEGRYRVSLWLFGILPLGWQVIGVEFPQQPQRGFALRDNGFSPLIRRWDHLITIEPGPDGSSACYTDELTLEAGFLTPVVALFVRLFFAHRQRRLRKLAARDFQL